MLFWIPVLMLLYPTVSATEPQKDNAAVVDRTVAIVGELVVTRSDIALHSALSDVDTSFVPILQSSKDESVQHTIDAAIIRHQDLLDGILCANTKRFRRHWPLF